jgi:(R,R)-butanediol dehydrogenase/meso-butanediol dehydrogenase/diacetyl reductase
MLGMDGQPGGFAELLAVRPEQIRRLGVNTPDRSAVLAEPLASALRLYRRIEAFQSRGTRFVLFGAGLEGSLLLQLMRNAGGWQAAVVEPSPDRRQAALDWGASLALDPAAGDTAQAIREWAGGGLADIGVDAFGSSDCRRAMVDCVRPDGVAVLFGLRDVRTEFDVASLIMHGKRLVTSFGYTGTDFGDAVRLLDKGAVDLGAHSEVWSMSEAGIAMERASGRPGPILKHVLAWPAL